MDRVASIEENAPRPLKVSPPTSTWGLTCCDMVSDFIDLFEVSTVMNGINIDVKIERKSFLLSQKIGVWIPRVQNTEVGLGHLG